MSRQGQMEDGAGRENRMLIQISLPMMICLTSWGERAGGGREAPLAANGPVFWPQQAAAGNQAHYFVICGTKGPEISTHVPAQEKQE